VSDNVVRIGMSLTIDGHTEVLEVVVWALENVASARNLGRSETEEKSIAKMNVCQG
jgi:hypothetical protein